MSAIDEATPIVRKLLLELVEAGFTIDCVDDGGEDLILLHNDAEAMEAIFAVECARLFVIPPTGEEGQVNILLISSNGVDVISDYTDVPELDAVMDRVLAPDDAFYIAGAIDRIDYWGLGDEIEVHSVAPEISRSADGAFVQAWIWVPND